MSLVKTAITLINNASQIGQKSEYMHSLNYKKMERNEKGI